MYDSIGWATACAAGNHYKGNTHACLQRELAVLRKESKVSRSASVLFRFCFLVSICAMLLDSFTAKIPMVCLGFFFYKFYTRPPCAFYRKVSNCQIKYFSFPFR